ncbi:MAG: YbbR-like domain-containing protein [Prevotella sp.]|nr:YbbR-like domain-containing protein [Prevotella sp.]
MLMALNETVEREYLVPVRLVGVPKDVVVTTDIEDTVRVTLRDKGFTLLAYLSGERFQPLSFNFKNYTAKDNGRGQVPLADMQKQLYQLIYNSTKITSVKPDKLEFYYNHGVSKQVPVRLYGSVTPAKNYYLARTAFTPQQVTVYADKAMLDSIRYVTTDYQRILNIEDTVSRTVTVKSIRGAKIVPSEVKVTIYPDILTEEAVDVPIVAVNMPAGKVLRTFPSRVKVRFVIGASQFRQIKPEQFRVEADYNDLMAHPADKCTLFLRKTPAGVKNARLDVAQVDYLIEQ